MIKADNYRRDETISREIMKLPKIFAQQMLPKYRGPIETATVRDAKNQDDKIFRR